MELFDKLYAGAKWGVGVSIDRTNGLPLDRNSIFPSYDLAVAYAAKNETAIAAELTKLGIDTKISNNAYAGQVLAVVTETETAIYYIDANMQLQEVGGKVSVDNGSIVADEDGKLYLYGFTAAADTTLPRVKTVDGKKTIEWVTVNDLFQDTNTVTTITAKDKSVDVVLGTDTAAAKTYTVGVNVSAVEGNKIVLKDDGLYVETPAAYDDTQVKADIKANSDAIALKANAADVYAKSEVYTKTETDSKVNEIVNKVITDAVEGDTLTSLTELVQYINEHGGEAAEMATAITNLENNKADKTALATTEANAQQAISAAATADGKAVAAQNAVDALTLVVNGKEEAGVAAELVDAAKEELQGSINGVDAKFASYTTTESLNTLLAGKASTGDLSSAVERIVALETDNTANKTNISNNSTAIQNHAVEFATFKGAVEAKQEAYDSAISALQGADTTINGRLDALEAADEVHDNAISALQTKDSDLEDAIAENVAAIARIDASIDGEGGYAARLTAVEAVAAQNTTDIDTNATNIANIVTAIGNVKGDGVEASGIKGDIEALDARMDAVEEVAAGAATTAGNAEAKVNSLQEQFDELVAEGGEPNTISTLQVNGTSITPINKVANVAIAIDGKNSSIETVADAANGKVTATIKKVSTDLLVSGDDVLILDCGNA